MEEGDDVEGRHLCVEGVGVFEVVVPDLVDGVPEELSGAALSRFVGGEVVEAGFVGRFRSDTNNRGGVVCDAPVVEWESGGNGEGYLEDSVRSPTREWTPPRRSKGISIRIRSSVSQIKRRSSSVGFPSMGGKMSLASSLKRRVIASGSSQKFDCCFERNFWEPGVGRRGLQR